MMIAFTSLQRPFAMYTHTKLNLDDPHVDILQIIQV